MDDDFDFGAWCVVCDKAIPMVSASESRREPEEPTDKARKNSASEIAKKIQQLSIAERRKKQGIPVKPDKKTLKNSKDSIEAPPSPMVPFSTLYCSDECRVRDAARTGPAPETSPFFPNSLSLSPRTSTGFQLDAFTIDTQIANNHNQQFSSSQTDPSILNSLNFSARRMSRSILPDQSAFPQYGTLMSPRKFPRQASDVDGAAMSQSVPAEYGRRKPRPRAPTEDSSRADGHRLSYVEGRTPYGSHVGAYPSGMTGYQAKTGGYQTSPGFGPVPTHSKALEGPKTSFGSQRSTPFGSQKSPAFVHPRQTSGSSRGERSEGAPSRKTSASALTLALLGKNDTSPASQPQSSVPRQSFSEHRLEYYRQQEKNARSVSDKLNPAVSASVPSPEQFSKHRRSMSTTKLVPITATASILSSSVTASHLSKNVEDPLDSDTALGHAAQYTPFPQKQDQRGRKFSSTVSPHRQSPASTSYFSSSPRNFYSPSTRAAVLKRDASNSPSPLLLPTATLPHVPSYSKSPGSSIVPGSSIAPSSSNAPRPMTPSYTLPSPGGDDERKKLFYFNS